MTRIAAAPKGKRSCMTASELYVYIVAFMCGVSMLMPINAVFSAPLYMMNYYSYAMQDEDAKPTMTNFWNNVLTYYNVIGLVTSLVMEPLTLTATFRRIPMRLRLFGGLAVLILEIIVLMAVPAHGTSEGGAVATICIVGFVSGFGKSIFESTTYGMFGAFPTSFTSTMMGGVGMSGVITSLIQVMVQATLPNTYEGRKKQSYIYYSLDAGIQIATLCMLALLRFNDFANDHFGDLGALKSKVDAGSLTGDRLHHGGSRQESVEPAMGELPAAKVAKKDDPAAPSMEEMEEDCDAVRVVEGPTSNEVLLATDIFGTLKTVKWMFISCGFNFLVTLYVFPTIATGMFPDSKWFGTVTVLVFNVCDVLGRWSPSLKFLWPSYERRWTVVAASFARVIFVPLLLLYSYRYIPSHAYGYVMSGILLGYSNGYVGSMSLVLGPQTRGIDNDGKRFVAGTLMGISILVGGTIGSVLSIMTQTLRE